MQHFFKKALERKFDYLRLRERCRKESNSEHSCQPAEVQRRAFFSILVRATVVHWIRSNAKTAAIASWPRNGPMHRSGLAAATRATANRLLFRLAALHEAFSSIGMPARCPLKLQTAARLLFTSYE